LQLRELGRWIEPASLPHGLPDHFSEDALRAFAGNDEEEKQRKQNKEAERHQALIRILRVIGRGSHP
jgi:hypothetical protein